MPACEVGTPVGIGGIQNLAERPKGGRETRESYADSMQIEGLKYVSHRSSFFFFVSTASYARFGSIPGRDGFRAQWSWLVASSIACSGSARA